VQPPRVLLAILVYGGAEFVPACLQSAAGLRAGPNRVDVLVLDDCSPDAAWSAEVERMSAALDIGYYRSPRNLGIPRSMNLALLRAQSGGYDHVIIANSDVVFPLNLATALVAVAEANPDAGSVTAWSNNVSIFSLPSPDRAFLAQQDVVDWIAYQLEGEFGTAAADIPTAVGFCMLVPTPVAARVGLFDPVFGRGYCEEVDWSRRAKALGFRNLLSLSTFVFHYGGASTRAAGLLVGDATTTVAAHERIIDFRHAGYRAEVELFERSQPLAPQVARGSRAVVLAAARRWGYKVEATAIQASSGAGVPFLVPPGAGRLVATGHYGGFATDIAVDDRADPAAAFLAAIGRPPDRVILHDRGRNADRLAGAAWGDGVPVEDRNTYPQRVW
jgi:GT2 family glycosyltransferase